MTQVFSELCRTDTTPQSILQLFRIRITVSDSSIDKSHSPFTQIFFVSMLSSEYQAYLDSMTDARKTTQPVEIWSELSIFVYANCRNHELNLKWVSAEWFRSVSCKCNERSIESETMWSAFFWRKKHTLNTMRLDESGSPFCWRLEICNNKNLLNLVSEWF